MSFTRGKRGKGRKGNAGAASEWNRALGSNGWSFICSLIEFIVKQSTLIMCMLTGKHTKISKRKSNINLPFLNLWFCIRCKFFYCFRPNRFAILQEPNVTADAVDQCSQSEKKFKIRGNTNVLPLHYSTHVIVLQYSSYWSHGIEVD